MIGDVHDNGVMVFQLCVEFRKKIVRLDDCIVVCVDDILPMLHHRFRRVLIRSKDLKCLCIVSTVIVVRSRCMEQQQQAVLICLEQRFRFFQQILICRRTKVLYVFRRTDEGVRQMP